MIVHIRGCQPKLVIENRSIVSSTTSVPSLLLPIDRNYHRELEENRLAITF